MTFHEHQDPDDPIRITGDLEQIWNDIQTVAGDARHARSRSELYRAARWLIQASREVERVLGPEVATREVSGDLAGQRKFLLPSGRWQDMVRLKLDLNRCDLLCMLLHSSQRSAGKLSRSQVTATKS